MARRLVVTADDFGASREINEAVEEAHRRGILTSASLMVAGEAAGEAVRIAKRLPTLRVGLHLTVVDGRSALPPAEAGPLLGADGRLRTDLVWAGVAMFVRRSARRALALEIRAQFEAYRTTGLPLEHLDAHHHMHLHPTVSRLAIQTGREFGVRAVRLPREPQEILARSGDLPRGSRRNLLLEPWMGVLERRLRHAGLLFNDHLFGLGWTGGVTASRILRLLPHLPDGLNELYCHPASGNDELKALTSPEVVEAVRAERVVLTGFA